MFPEIKQIIDRLKSEKLKKNDERDIVPLFYLTGSNQILIEDGKGNRLALDAKLGIHNVGPIPLPKELSKLLPELEEMVVVTFDRNHQWLSKQYRQMPLRDLTPFLLSRLS